MYSHINYESNSCACLFWVSPWCSTDWKVHLWSEILKLFDICTPSIKNVEFASSLNTDKQGNRETHNKPSCATLHVLKWSIERSNSIINKKFKISMNMTSWFPEKKDIFGCTWTQIICISQQNFLCQIWCF